MGISLTLCRVFAMGMLLTASTSISQAAVKYSVDKAHSTIMFRAKRMDTVYVYGRFNEFAGSFVADSETPSNSSIDIEIQAGSIQIFSMPRNSPPLLSKAHRLSKKGTEPSRLRAI